MSDTQTTSKNQYFGLEVPLMEYLGLKPDVLESGYCSTSLALEPHLCNSRGDIHGGTMMSALDFTLTAAAISHDPGRTGGITIEMSTHFLSAARSDITIKARCIRRGNSIAFCEGEVIDSKGIVIAVARGTFKLVRRAMKVYPG